MSDSNKNCYSDNLSKLNSDDDDLHISKEDSDLFYFDITGNREIIQVSPYNGRSVIKLSNDIASEEAVAVENNSILRNNNLPLEKHCRKRSKTLMYDGKLLPDSTGKIVSSKNHKNLAFVDLTNGNCEVTQTDGIYTSEIKKERKRNKLDSQLKMDSYYKDVTENIPFSSTIIEQVNCDKFTAVSEGELNKSYNENAVVSVNEELIEGTCEDKRKTNKHKKKFSSPTLQKEENENITHCYVNEEYAKHRKNNIESKEKDCISLQNTEIFHDINAKKKNKKTQSKKINEMSNEQNQIETSGELDNYSTRIKKKKKKVKEIFCENVITKECPNCKEKLQIVSCSDENMLDVTVKRKKKKKKIDLEILDRSSCSSSRDNYEEQQGEEHCYNLPMCHTSEMEELNRQKTGIEDTYAFNSCSHFKKKKKKKTNVNSDTEVDSNVIQGEIISSFVWKGSDNVTGKKKNQSYCEELNRSVDICNTENVSNYSSFVKKKKKKAKKNYCEDENELQTEINSVTNEEILDLVKNKKTKKKTYSEYFEAEEPSDSQYEVGRKYRKKNVNNEDKVINENCDGKSWDEIIDDIDMAEVNKKKKKRRIGSENLDESINAYSRDNHEEQREQFHNGFKCSNSEINELDRQKSGVVDMFKMSNNSSKKKKKKKMIKDDKFANDNTQLDSNCNDGIQVAMVSSTNRKILHDGFMKKNKESRCKKLDTAIDLCSAEMYNELTTLNKKKKKNIEFIDCQVASASKKRRRRLSKFAQQFRMKNKKRKCVTVEDELTYLEEDVSYFCIEDLHINIPFPVHPLHTYCKRPSRPRPEEIAAAQEANLKIKSGIFTEAEDNKIRENWQAFCKEHRLNVDPSDFFNFPRRMNIEEKLKFLQYLGHGLEDRLLYRVHYRFKKIFQDPVMKQGRFTKKEDEQILMYLTSTQSKRPFKDLAQILNRTNLSIEKRYDYLSSAQKPRIKWTVDVVDQLVNHMLKMTKSEDIDGLRNVKFTSKQWLKLSKKMGYISVRRIQRAWKVYIYPRLFSDDYVDLVKMKKKIIKILYKRNETDWRSVNWEEIAAKFEGFTAQKIYMMFKQTVNFHAPEEVSKNLKDCVDYMKNIFLKESKLQSTHKFDKFIYKDGHVQYKSIDSCSNNLE